MKKFFVILSLSALAIIGISPESAEAGVLLRGSKVRVNIRTPRARLRNVAESTSASRRTQPNIDVDDNEYDDRITKINQQYARYYQKLDQYNRKQARKLKRAREKAERERQEQLEDQRRAYEVAMRKHRSTTAASNPDKKPSGFASLLARRDNKETSSNDKVELTRTSETGANGAPKKKLSFLQHMWRALFGS